MAEKRVTILPGVRYRQHPTRKHGVKFDRYFSIYYRIPDPDKPKKTKKVEEGLGWASQGWTAEKALGGLTKLKAARRTGEGPQTLQEKRDIKAKQSLENATKKEQAQRDSFTFSQVFAQYFESAKKEKVQGSVRREEQLYRQWIKSVLGDTLIKDIHGADVEKVRDAMAKAGKAPRTVEYCLAVIRQVFNYARNMTPPLFVGENPTSRVKIKKADNKRVRFLTHEEADVLLIVLKQKSNDMHDIALVSLRAGLRASEVFNLTWNDVDFTRNILFIKDTKSDRNRFVPMTDDVKQMLSERKKGTNSGFIFLARGGANKRIESISRSFERAVKEIGLNDGITDPRQKVCYHSLRHTYASHLVESGVDLYIVQKLLGHSVITQTIRYSHIGESTLQNAVKALNGKIKEGVTNEES